MSEVDRLSNSGLYPMLPISDRQGGKQGGSNPSDPRTPPPNPKAPDPSPPQPPKSLIDEYA